MKKKYISTCLIMLLVIISCNDSESGLATGNGSNLNAAKDSMEHIAQYCRADFVDMQMIDECMTDEHVHIDRAWNCMKKQVNCELILECTEDNFICNEFECSGVEVDCKDSVYFDQITQRWDFRSAFGNCSGTSSSGLYTETDDFLSMSVSVCIKGQCLSGDEILDVLCN